MTQLTGPVQVVGQSLFSTSSTALHRLGETVFANNGNAYRYAKAGAVALVPGTLQQASAETTAHQNLTAAAAAIGETSIVTSAITTTADQYLNGWLVVTVTPGQGYQYEIKANTVGTSAACTLTLADPILVALTTSSRYDLVTNPNSGVVINPTTATSAPAGVSIYPVAIGEFGWLQVGGVANVLADGTVTVGTSLVASNATAGAVEAFTGVQAIVGLAVTGIATTQYGAVKLIGLL